MDRHVDFSLLCKIAKEGGTSLRETIFCLECDGVPMTAAVRSLGVIMGILYE